MKEKKTEGRRKVENECLRAKREGVENDALKNYKRSAYQEKKRKVKGVDVVLVTRIARLGRNYFEKPAEWQKITKEKRGKL